MSKFIGYSLLAASIAYVVSNNPVDKSDITHTSVSDPIESSTSTADRLVDEHHQSRVGYLSNSGHGSEKVHRIALADIDEPLMGAALPDS